MLDPIDKEAEMSMTEWVTKFGDKRDQKATAELAAKFMFAMSHYYSRMRLHIMLHPLFFLTGFLTAYFLLGE